MGLPVQISSRGDRHICSVKPDTTQQSPPYLSSLRGLRFGLGFVFLSSALHKAFFFLSSTYPQIKPSDFLILTMESSKKRKLEAAAEAARTKSVKKDEEHEEDEEENEEEEHKGEEQRIG